MTSAAPPEGKPRPILGRIGAVLTVVQTVIAYARHFAATVPTRASVPEFATVAAIFGTYDIPVILHRVQRGLLHALALQRYLLARAARGRNLRFAWRPQIDLQPRHRPPPGPARPPRPARASKRHPDPATLGPDDPAAYRMPTQEQLDAWVRSRPVGRTMAYICMDLGIVPGLCDGTFWNKIDWVLRFYGGSLDRMYRIREKRAESFLRERDARPDTWHIDWRDLSKSTVRTALGCVIGETPPPPDGLMLGVPSIAPS